MQRGTTDIRTAIYTTNSVESLNRLLRKIIKIRRGFPNEDAALKLLFLALRTSGEEVDHADGKIATLTEITKLAPLLPYLCWAYSPAPIICSDTYGSSPTTQLSCPGAM